MSPTETADLFYIEAVLLRRLGVKWLSHSLRMKIFQEFCLKLDDLASFYMCSASDVKIKIYASLGHLETDLFKISHLPRCSRESDLHVDLIVNSRIRRMNCVPLKSIFLTLIISAKMKSSFFLCSRFPVCQPLPESFSELLPATFLQPPLPMLIPFIERMCSITDGVIAEKPQQVEPLPQLLMKTSKALSSEISWTEGVKFVVPLPASEYHSYVFPGSPSHTPATSLHYWISFAISLPSTSSVDAGWLCDLRCEILPESDHCLSVTFSLDDSIHLAVTEVDSHQMSCRLLMPDFVDHKLNNDIFRVLMRCMSIPITMRAIRRKVNKKSELSLALVAFI
uniref:Mediator of RNA polymerase II transcription subunit 1 n=1 Tax=Cyprinus carpio TaxID=7962 RepID=A0A8C2CR50_CYPCA